MRWYVNDASLQAQFVDLQHFESVLRSLLAARSRVAAIKQNLRSTRSLQEALAGPNVSVRQFLQQCADRDLKSATFNWLDRTGPFVDDDRLEEQDDYFEYRGREVTETGLGEAARRTKAIDDCASFSFEGGEIDFAIDHLDVDHGLIEERHGSYRVRNHWKADDLVDHALESGPQIRTWLSLVETARARFEHLDIGDLHENPVLAREPFQASVRDRALALMRLLNDYMSGRDESGAEGLLSRHVIETHFTGERALFTGESSTNEKKFRNEMTFVAADDREVFAPWHGKISHRYFRMHFEWPVAPQRRKLPILYLGPKITKS